MAFRMGSSQFRACVNREFTDEDWQRNVIRNPAKSKSPHSSTSTSLFWDYTHESNNAHGAGLGIGTLLLWETDGELKSSLVREYFGFRYPSEYILFARNTQCPLNVRSVYILSSLIAMFNYLMPVNNEYHYTEYTEGQGF